MCALILQTAGGYKGLTDQLDLAAIGLMHTFCTQTMTQRQLLCSSSSWPAGEERARQITEKVLQLDAMHTTLLAGVQTSLAEVAMSE